jgi:hypothetical protein
MKILVKFPTRSRPEKFLSTLQGYIDNTVGVATVDYLITCDSDDPTMNADVIKRIQDMTDRATINHGSSTSKIHAINRGMAQYKEHWDIVVLASDDMICVQHGWDQIIADTMAYHFPDTDGGLWFWDGDHQTRRNGLCTMNIMGRKYYERFGYLYHPSYISLWCDNEYTEVGKRLNKLPFFDQVLFKHVHFSNTPGLAPDELMRKTQSYFKQDMVNYHNRHAKAFGLHEVNS